MVEGRRVVAGVRRRGRPRFGLLHGLGFASALREVGLPENAIPTALLFFNLGVELGQLAFVGVVLALLASLRSLQLPAPAWSWRLASYGIGAVTMYWTIERVVAFAAWPHWKR